MPNRMEDYKDQKKFKATHRKQNDRYYKRLSVNNENAKQKWTIHDIELVLAHEQPDRALSEQLGRSVKAIQEVRRVYKNKDLSKMS